MCWTTMKPRVDVSRLNEDTVREEIRRLDACDDDYQRLQVSRDADANAVRKAFILISRGYHPDLCTRESRVVQELSEEVFIRFSEAERRLRKVVSSGRPGSRDSTRAPTRASSS